MSALFLIGLVACTEEEKLSTKEVTKTDEKSNEPSQDELDAQLKEDAVQADFVKLNSDEATKGEKVFAEGEITNISKEGVLGEFTLTTEEKDGSGMYMIKVLAAEAEFTKGDQVKIFGITEGKDDLGFPIINATILENK